MLVSVVQKHHHWVVLLVVSFLWMLLVPGKPVLGEKAFMSIPDVFEVQGVLSNRELPSTSGR